MTQMQYSIPATVRFNYNYNEGKDGGEGTHQLYLIYDWTSPITGIPNASHVLLNQSYDSNKLDFYKYGELMMKNKYQMYGFVVDDMANALRKELEESGGIDFTQIAKQKFEECLKTTYDFNVQIDLDKTTQDGLKE